MINRFTCLILLLGLSYAVIPHSCQSMDPPSNPAREVLGMCPDIVYTTGITQETSTRGKLNFVVSNYSYSLESDRPKSVSRFVKAKIEDPSMITCIYGLKGYEIEVHASIPNEYDSCTVGGKTVCQNNSPKFCRIECTKN